jgi:hypothetical protein
MAGSHTALIVGLPSLTIEDSSDKVKRRKKERAQGLSIHATKKTKNLNSKIVFLKVSVPKRRFPCITFFIRMIENNQQKKDNG